MSYTGTGAAVVGLAQVPPGECLVSGVYELLTMGTVTSSHHDHPAKRRGTTDVADFTTHGLVFQSSYKLADGRYDLPKPSPCLMHVCPATLSV